MGYLDLPEKTKSALDEEGWLHSGDIAQIDDQGNVIITGRLKVLPVIEFIRSEAYFNKRHVYL